jgi:hypothetical protein
VLRHGSACSTDVIRLLAALQAQVAGLSAKGKATTSQICWGLAAPSRLWSSSAEGTAGQSGKGLAKKLEEVSCSIVLVK